MLKQVKNDGNMRFQGWCEEIIRKSTNFKQSHQSLLALQLIGGSTYHSVAEQWSVIDGMVVKQWQTQPVCRPVNLRTTQWQNDIGVMLRNSLLECDDVSLYVLAVYRENTSSITEDLSKLNDREMLFLCSHYPSMKILSLMTVGHL